MKQTELAGIPVSITTKDELISEIKLAILEHRKLSLVAINARKVVRANEDQSVKHLITSFDIFLPDGSSIIQAIPEKVERITGVDMMDEILKHHEELNARIFLYGSSEEHNEKAKLAIIRRFQGINIVGSCDGYHDDMVLSQINHSNANIVFVAKGTPLQEEWIHAHKDQLHANIFLGVGGAFDVYSGSVKRAPNLVQKLGLEWLYRMLKEPKRFQQIPELLRFRKLVKKEKRKTYEVRKEEKKW